MDDFQMLALKAEVWFPLDERFETCMSDLCESWKNAPGSTFCWECLPGHELGGPDAPISAHSGLSVCLPRMVSGWERGLSFVLCPVSWCAWLIP